MKPISILCLIAWGFCGGYYYGYKSGATYEMNRSNNKLQHAHAVITNGVTKDKEDKWLQ